MKSIKEVMITSVLRAEESPVITLTKEAKTDEERRDLVQYVIDLIHYLTEEGYLNDGKQSIEDLEYYLVNPQELEDDTLSQRLLALSLISNYPLSQAFLNMGNIGGS